jgi:hypothetical protein
VVLEEQLQPEAAAVAVGAVVEAAVVREETVVREPVVQVQQVE